MIRPPPKSTLFPYPTLFQSSRPKGWTRWHRGGRGPPPSASAHRPKRAAGGSFAPPKYRAGRAPFPRWKPPRLDRKSTRLNSSHLVISYAVFCLKKKKNYNLMKHTYQSPSLPITIKNKSLCRESTASTSQDIRKLVHAASLTYNVLLATALC